MMAIDLIRFCREIMKRLSKSDVKMEDYRHVEMLDDYKQLVDNGHKKEYVMAVLREKYGLSESVSDATSEDEWWNTVVHEIDHLQHSICMYYGVEHGSEDCAYLQGELMRLILKGLYK